MSQVKQVSGRAVPVRGDDIDTDRIIPARYLKEITFSKMGDYPFFDERFNADGSKKPHPFNEERFQGAKVLIGNVNFGCGSSREHAPQSLMRWGNPAQPGIKAIIAESFAEIFAGNCVMLGVPAVTASKADVLAMQNIIEKHPELEWEVDIERLTARVKTPIALGSMSDVEPAVNQIFKVSLPESRRDALLKGTWDGTGLLIANLDKVRANAEKLAYMHGYQ